ncbi:C-type lectin domain family 4 member F-like isoform X2 [Neocloeon triangulifer]|uniref:C-type lectin domain family 4 member F-like isoform X2 n=1 Tax=Neocloeon triangulifer TaxID=2078957 RepID=UPI00286F65E8|nr:C-type lectin domain family 4 member F-like isoform X2 [Neocloeon triangulifer]
MGAASTDYVALFFVYTLALFALSEGTGNNCSSCKEQDCLQLEAALKKSEFLITEIKDIMLEKEAENRLVRKQIVDSKTVNAKAIEKLAKRLELVEGSSKTLANGVNALNSRSDKFSEELKTVAKDLNSTCQPKLEKEVQECDLLAEELANAKSSFDLELNKTKSLYEPKYMKYDKLKLKLDTLLKNPKNSINFANGRWYHYEETKLSWNDAKSFCEDRDMILPNTKTFGDSVVVWGKAGIMNLYVWIHGTDAGRPKGEYAWSDGTVVQDLSQGRWHYGEPLYNYADDAPQCMCLYLSRFYARPCTMKLSFVCEMPPETKE